MDVTTAFLNGEMNNNNNNNLFVPWKCGQLLVWDAMCPDTSYSKLEQLLNRQKIGRCGSINTLTHATFSLQWQ